MVFESVQSALEFYKAYGKVKGFGVSIRNSRLAADGTYQRVRIACTREGYPRSKRPRKGSIFASQKAGCKAKMSLVRSGEEDGKYIVNMVMLEHSHDLSPSKGKHFRCNRGISLGVRRTLEINDNAGIRVCNNYTTIVQEYGGIENMRFTKRDCRNYLDQQRRLRIAEGDAEAVRRYFEVMKSLTPNFFSKIEVDANCRVSSLFWADGRTRAAYQYFNDVVTFDITYLTNRYDMPFAPFCGVNHHGQTIMLGCGLIAMETVEAFEWLFSTWLECMGGVKPKAIITDQCRAIRRAVQTVFPGTRHRWCLWHIRQKLPQKLAALSTYRELEKRFSKLLYQCNEKEEFEDQWAVMIAEHGLEGNEWLKQLYAERAMWAPAFLTDAFWAGMASTQRSEGLNAFFDGYVNAQTSLNTFVDQHAIAQRRKVEKEAEADFQSYQTIVQCVTKLEYEKQYQLAYTNSKFMEIQRELQGIMGIFPEHVGKEHDWTVFLCDDGAEKAEKVHYNAELNEVRCNCKAFECRGILCSHAFAVLLKERVKEVNKIYIMDRWRKDIRRSYNYERFYSVAYDKRPEMQRYEELRLLLLQVAEMASEMAEMSAYVKDHANEMVTHLNSWKKQKEKELDTSDLMKGSTSKRGRKPVQDVRNAEGVECNEGRIGKELAILNPTRTKRRGRPRGNRMKTLVEKVVRHYKRKKVIEEMQSQTGVEEAGKKQNSRCIEEIKFASIHEVLKNSSSHGTEGPLPQENIQQTVLSGQTGSNTATQREYGRSNNADENNHLIESITITRRCSNRLRRRNNDGA